MSAPVYIETTIVSYLTAQPTRDLVLAARQELTREWWNEHKPRFAVYVSALVLREAAEGDRDAAARRLQAIAGIPSLGLKDEALALAQRLVQRRAIPSAAPEDALHIAVAAVHEMDYLLTWNFAHMANAIMRQRIEAAVADAGCRCPVICTPEELMDR
jgi:hypothetical protein